MLYFLQKLLNRPSVDYKQLVADGALIVDVRTPREFGAGHIKGSKNFPLDTIRTKVAELKKTGKPVITVCQSGARSGVAKNILKSAGIETYNGGPWSVMQSRIA